jgi:hypothetical protein
MVAMVEWIIGTRHIRRTEEERTPLRSESTAITTSVPIDPRVSAYPMGEDHPLLTSFGAFEDEPLWDNLIQSMAEIRQEERERELAELDGE